MGTSKWPSMERRGPVVTAKNIATFERELGHALPDDYREFLLDVNGGRTDDTNAVFSQGVLNGLFSLDAVDGDDDARDLKSRSERARKQLPHRDLLYVGYDGVGGKVLLVLSGDRRGEVWHQGGADARPPGSNPRVLWHDRRDMTKLADSWRAFMSSLKPIP